MDNLIGDIVVMMSEENMVDTGKCLITYRDAFNRTDAFENILRYVLSHSQDDLVLSSDNSSEESPLNEGPNDRPRYFIFYILFLLFLFFVFIYFFILFLFLFFYLFFYFIFIFIFLFYFFCFLFLFYKNNFIQLIYF